jgi:Domain of unknown function (DUF4178)
MSQASCPSCAAPVKFRGASSVVAVCAYCQSTLVRDGAKLEDIGKQSELLEDASLLQLGAEGRHRGVHFGVIGRIQYRYGAGVWNEWYLLFDDRRDGWLSDADGSYVITYLRPPPEVPAYESLKIGDRLTLLNFPFEITNLERTQVVAGEGELPFRFGSGWEAPVADLRGENGRFATLDYSETPVRLYVGEQLPFDTFAFSGLRDPKSGGKSTAKARAFRCAGCGAPLEKKLASTEAVGCGSCGTIMDVTAEEIQILSAAEAHARQVTPRFALGSRAVLQGAEHEVVGYMRRAMTADGVHYEWGEYLLHNHEKGYLWISEYQGHYNLIRTAANIPKQKVSLGPQQLSYLGRDYKHFQTCVATVTYVAGEFNWRVRLGDQVTVHDYVSPPLMLSCERTESELTWSLGEYTEPEMLWRAFKLKGEPEPKTGIAANQPSPYEGRPGRYWRWYGVALVLALLLQIGFSLGVDGRPLAELRGEAARGKPFEGTTAPFSIVGSRPRPLGMSIKSDVDNSWVAVNAVLTNAQTGEALTVGREIGYYSGWDGGESWSEGGRESLVRFPQVMPGTYTLTVEVDAAPDAQRPVTAAVSLYRSPPRWLNLFLLLGLLLVPPIWVTIRAAGYETRRWAESDHAPVAEDDDE